MSVLFYRRPDYVNPSSQPLSSNSCARYVEMAKNSERAIPKGLSFEEVIANKALPPCSLNDFMDYLIYIEHNAENLQFFLWYKNYCQRWEQLRETDRKLSPEWVVENEVPNLAQTEEKGAKAAKTQSKILSQVMGDAAYLNLFEEAEGPGVKSDGDSFVTSSFHNSVAPTNAEATAQAGLKWQAFTIQPNREECDSIIRHYLASNAPRELNLSHKDRTSLLHALQHTTHPSAFASAITIAEATLRGQSHPNFIRWSICNGNKPKIFFVRTMGVQGILLGFAVATILTLSKASRWWRIFAALLWFVGFSTMIAAYKGLCMILHKSHSRNLRPWEQDMHVGSELGKGSSTRRQSLATTVGGQTVFSSREGNLDDDLDDAQTLKFRPDSQQTFGSRNDWQNADWVSKYEKKNIVSKIFEENVWTQNETLKMLQDRIVLGANFWSLIVTVPLTVAFVALPNGNFF